MPIQFPVTIKDIKKSPYAVLVFILLITAGYFINEVTRARDNCDDKLTVKDNVIYKLQHEKDSISGKYFDVLLELTQEKYIQSKKDSILRSKTEDPAKQIIQN